MHVDRRVDQLGSRSVLETFQGASHSQEWCRCCIERPVNHWKPSRQTELAVGYLYPLSNKLALGWHVVKGLQDELQVV